MIAILGVLVEVVASFIEIFIMYDIFQILLSKNRKLKKTRLNWAIMIVGLLIVQGLNAITLFSYATIIVIVLFWSITAKFLYATEYTTALSITGLYVLTTVVYDFFFFSAIGALWGGYDTFMLLIGDSSQARMLVVIATKLIWVVCYGLLRKHFAKVQLNSESRNFFMKITVTGCIGCLILAKLTFDAFPYAINQAWFLMICVLVCFIFFNSFVMNSRANKAQLEMIALRNQLLEENFETLNDVYSQNAKLYHDLNNHLDALYQLLDSDMVDDAKEYIERIGEPVKVLNKISWTGVDVIDMILNSKLVRAEKCGINLTYNVEFPANSGIKPSDMCSILSNLIDNAIEAVTKSNREKEIKVTIRKINNFITIQVINTIFESVMVRAGKIVTTKRDTALHGWGMQSVKATAEKYEGTVKYSCDRQQFVVMVVLFY